VPGTLWSAPQPNLNSASASPAIAAALTDISPSEVLIRPGDLALGTRIRLFACGEYTTTSATPTCILGFYMNAVGTAIGTTAAKLGATSAVNSGASSTAVPWQLIWYGFVKALTGPADAANASVYGQGRLYWATTLTAWAQAGIPFPVTAAERTVAQTATGLITTGTQKVMVGSTWSTTTGVTSMTCQELTCELIG
jgi:hypothetical protein